MTKAQALLFVRCERCSRKFGDGTRLGRMLLVDNRWAWNELRRQRRWRGLRDRQVQGVRVDLVFTGSVQMSCRRCGAKPRLSLRTLGELSEVVQRNGGSAVLVS